MTINLRILEKFKQVKNTNFKTNILRECKIPGTMVHKFSINVYETVHKSCWNGHQTVDEYIFKVDDPDYARNLAKALLECADTLETLINEEKQLVSLKLAQRKEQHKAKKQQGVDV